MASYQELNEVVGAPGVLEQVVRGAIAIRAREIYDEPQGAQNEKDARIPFADAVFSDRDGVKRMFDLIIWALVADNKDVTMAQILGADDLTVQAAVDNYVTSKYGPIGV